MFKKTDVRRYDVRHKQEWAVVLLTGDGVFTVVSTYGNYGHYWSHTDCTDVRDFFLGMPKDWHYFAKKLCSTEVIDEEKTQKALCEFLAGRHPNYTEVELTKLLVDIPDSLNALDIEYWLEEEHDIEESAFDLCDCIHRKLNPQITALVQMLIEHWVPVLKRELELEKQNALT